MRYVQTISTPKLPAKMVTVGATMEKLTACMKRIQASTTLLQDDRDDINLFMHLSIDLFKVLQSQTEPFKVLSERLYAQNCDLADQLLKQHMSKPQTVGGNA